MKLKDIILEADDALGFKTTKTDVDPETGAITWDVEYTPLIKIDRDLENIAAELETAVKKHSDDVKLAQYNELFKNFKKAFRSHVTKHYGKK